MSSGASANVQAVRHAVTCTGCQEQTPLGRSTTSPRASLTSRQKKNRMLKKGEGTTVT